MMLLSTGVYPYFLFVSYIYFYTYLPLYSYDPLYYFFIASLNAYKCFLACLFSPLLLFIFADINSYNTYSLKCYFFSADLLGSTYFSIASASSYFFASYKICALRTMNCGVVLLLHYSKAFS